MPHQVLARKWRPKNFSELVGQDTIVKTLSNALAQNRLHHAYLFTGTRGVGKTTLARIIAKCFNCEIGVTAMPCGVCSVCTAIDAGQFVDLIEVDAASRTKVEDTRELLDNVQYAPSQGRYKIYLIDEVHMLSGHSFNALLKTLEEPPEHVKFLLATTDPHKLPITILSRCLQFHLKAIMPEMIATHLAEILKHENITADAEALNLISNAADGSMRDALSLLDQAIAYCGGQITTESTRTMLGSTATVDLIPLLQAIAMQNGPMLFEHIAQLTSQGADFNQVLLDLLSLLHKIAVYQMIPTLYQNDSDINAIKTLAAEFSKNDVQLYYQIALLGQRDLAYAPSLRSGFEMTMLRMMSFTPVENASVKSPSNPPKSQTPTPKITPSFASTTAPNSSERDWASIVADLPISAMTKVLAQNCILVIRDEQKIHLQLDKQHAALLNEKLHSQLASALQQTFNTSARLVIDIENHSAKTPQQQWQEQQQNEKANAKSALLDDPHLKALLEDFDATLDENTIELKHK